MNQQLANYYLSALDIQSWRLRNQTINEEVDSTLNHPLQSLEETVSQCKACRLHEGRTQTVFGVGNPQADVVFIGEAPGFYEDQQGEPFVGKAGELLNAMLKAIQLERSDVYIANILKCRPPENRDPLPSEIETCTPFLKQQIDLIQPKLLVALGRYAAHYLLETNLSLAKMRLQEHTFAETKIPVIVTYHPAYLLRNPAEKKNAYVDLKRIRHLLEYA